MDPLENTLSTLRRTHFALFIAAAAILILLVPAGPDYDGALEEVKILREAIGPGGYQGHCASVAAELYGRVWSGVARRIDRWEDSEVRYSDSVRVSGAVQCPIPSFNEPLDVYADFFLENQFVWILSVDTVELAEALRANRPTDPEFEDAHDPRYGWKLDEILLLAIALDSIDLSTAFRGEDTLRVQFIDKRTLSDTDSVIVWATYAGHFPERRATRSIGFAVDSRGSSGRSQRPLDWLAETTWGQEALSTNRDGEIVIFPRLQPFWEQISTHWLSDGARYLQARAEEQQANVEILGLEVSTGPVAWAGPFILLAILVYLFVHLQHLGKLAHIDPDALRMYPWIALFEGALSRVLLFLSVVVLPVLAAAAVSARMVRSSPGASVWAALISLGCLVMGFRAFAEVRHLRATVSETVTTPTAAG